MRSLRRNPLRWPLVVVGMLGSLHVGCGPRSDGSPSAPSKPAAVPGMASAEARGGGSAATTTTGTSGTSSPDTGRAGSEGQGRILGEVDYALPAWLKTSFLDFREDVAEARAKGKHVLVFLHLDHCPYCARMMTEDFVDPATQALLTEHFDVIAVNIRGDREVTWLDGRTYSERALADHLQGRLTPTLVFADLQGKVVLQLTGYRDLRSVRQALEFVRTRSYQKQSFVQYVEAHPLDAVYALRAHPLFTDTKGLKGYAKPLAILFEDRGCAECARFHEKTLQRPDVLAEMKKLRIVRLDTGSKERFVGVDGRETSAAAWASELKLTYRPSVVLFDQGREILRIEYRAYPYDFRESLRFVSGKHYEQYGSRGEYGAARRKELLAAGQTIDYGE